MLDSKQDFPVSDSSAVVIIDAATRHMKPEEAYRTVYDIVMRAKQQGFDFVYKQTDSALRGNVGSELSAVLAASGNHVLPFFPAYPKINRTTVQGVHYIDGVPVSESVFGRDPFEPVKTSYIPDLIALQSNVQIQLIDEWTERYPMPQEPTIMIFDCRDTETMHKRILQQKYTAGALQIMAGCAAAAEFLPQMLSMDRIPVAWPKIAVSSFIISGSLNPITLQQIDNAEHTGFPMIDIPCADMIHKYNSRESCLLMAEQIKNHFSSKQSFILRITQNELISGQIKHDAQFRHNSHQIAAHIGMLLSALIETGMEKNIVITGGDTLHNFLQKASCSEIIPLEEIETGVILSMLTVRNKKIALVSKSGGFGSEEVFSKIDAFLRKKASYSAN